MSRTEVIVFDHVNFSYKKDSQEPVLKDINISIRSGETIGIIGGTGSAKSSLVNLISRLYDVTDGSVSVGGIDVRKYHLESLRNQVSVVLQKNVLFSGTILENLRWGDKNATEEECRRACQLACADDFIEKCRTNTTPSLNRRLQCFRRPEAASLYRPCSSEEAKDTDPG